MIAAKYAQFEEWHFRLIRRVLGEKGERILARVPLFPVDGRSRVEFDKDWERIMLNTRDIDNPFVIVHEVAHVYCAVEWRDLMLTAPTHRCEAAAYLAERFLSVIEPGAEPFYLARRQSWLPEARTLADKVPYRPPLHNSMHEVLSGAFG